MFRVDAVVIGAGAVGLACAAHLSASGRSVVVLERGPHVGEGISSRNSEVIHAGIYYATGSLKHRMCIRGREMLYEWLETRSVPYRKCGKIIVAADDLQIERVETLKLRAEENGVPGMALMSAGEVARLEPEVRSVSGLMSPETGVFDSHQYLLSLVAEIEAHDGTIACQTPFAGAEVAQNGFIVRTGGAEPFELETSILINSAGLHAHQIAKKIDGFSSHDAPDLHLAKGSYFRLAGPPPFSHLIYPAPAPNEGGLGVHATIDIAGQVKFGPDVEWLPDGSTPEDVDYRVDPARADRFLAAIQRYWPGVTAGRLRPDYTGCRPKLTAPGEMPADFLIQTQADHGIPGLVNLFGIESPGLTGSLAIAEYVAANLP